MAFRAQTVPAAPPSEQSASSSIGPPSRASPSAPVPPLPAPPPATGLSLAARRKAALRRSLGVFSKKKVVPVSTLVEATSPRTYGADSPPRYEPLPKDYASAPSSSREALPPSLGPCRRTLSTGDAHEDCRVLELPAPRATSPQTRHQRALTMSHEPETLEPAHKNGLVWFFKTRRSHSTSSPVIEPNPLFPKASPTSPTDDVVWEERELMEGTPEEDQHADSEPEAFEASTPREEPKCTEKPSGTANKLTLLSRLVSGAATTRRAKSGQEGTAEPEGDPDSEEDFAFIVAHAGREEAQGGGTASNFSGTKAWFRRNAAGTTARNHESQDTTTVSTCTPSPYFGATIGQLYVTVMGARSLQTKQSFVAAALQGQVQRTPVVTGAFPEWATELAFNLYDISGDVHFAVYDQPLVRAPCCVGRVVVPLADLLRPALFARCGALSEPVSLWYELYPPKRMRFHDDELTSKFLPGVRNIKGSGMAKPKRPLGFLHLQFQVLTCESLAKLFFTPRWLDKQGPTGPPIQRVLMKYNFLRCKKAFSIPRLVKIVLEDNRATWIAPCLLQWFCFTAKAWQIPPTALMLVMLGGWVSYIHKRDLYESVIIWEENVEMEAEEGYRLQKYTQRVQDFQNVVGIWATAMERCGNLFNWSDPYVTGVLYALLSTLCALLSLALVLLPARHVAFLLGLASFALAVYLHRRRLARNKGRDRKLLEKLTLPRNLLGHFLARVPDNAELTHRFIARCAQVEEGPGLPPALPCLATPRGGAKPKARKGRALGPSRAKVYPIDEAEPKPEAVTEAAQGGIVSVPSLDTESRYSSPRNPSSLSSTPPDL